MDTKARISEAVMQFGGEMAAYATAGGGLGGVVALATSAEVNQLVEQHGRERYCEGVVTALQVLNSHDGPTSHEYRDLVQTHKLAELLDAATRLDVMDLSGLSEYVANTPK